MVSEEEAVLIDGRKTSASIKERVKEDAVEVAATRGRKPKLAVVMVGDRGDSATYVRMKSKACTECGLDFELVEVPNDVSQKVLESRVEAVARDSTVDGMIVQLPLPEGIDEHEVLGKIPESKDVDGLLPANFGKLAMKGHTPSFIPCTAFGCLELCKRYDIPISGKNVVVLGRSNIVGLPVALLFQQENATVTICHSRTANLPEFIGKADIVVVAIGKAKLVKGEWLKAGAVVIDAGINATVNEEGKTKLVGDCDFDSCKAAASYITPVPGGVGPMTVAMLMKNVVIASKSNS